MSDGARGGARRRRRAAWLVAGAIGLALAVAALAAAPHVRSIVALMGMFDDAHRAERFRTLHELVPSRVVRAGDDPWVFERDERPLPPSYRFDGEERSLTAFLEASETTGLVVVHEGVIVHEAYARGNDAASLATSFSVAKSVTSALVGIALERGLVASLDGAIGDVVPDLARGGYEGVPIRDVLTMASGVAWSEDYADPRSDVMGLPVRLFVLRQAVPRVLAGLPRDAPSGAAQRYASSDTLALGLLLERATGAHPAAFLEEALWLPAGMEADAAWGSDHHGHALTYAFLGATLRDLARFGRLYLEGGRRDGVQVVPEAWVEASLTAVGAPPASEGGFGAGLGYGYQWWVPEGDDGEALAMGIYGQFVYLHRGHGVVIVKTSTDPDHLDREGETLAAFRAIAASLSAAAGSD